MVRAHPGEFTLNVQFFLFMLLFFALHAHFMRSVDICSWPWQSYGASSVHWSDLDGNSFFCLCASSLSLMEQPPCQE
ncbi:hypothetical protein B0J13DRAFT_566942 [Dactylonectria estremocensis]|uniref:Uncharacterized protein n=1 Tax=Dactylonectria estremocensis TaxID=1079267 RepID=A0A9P9DM75_9HYPO|nr:hypothetical protein B0J13DRAFT_566942 [Dactylonectria estremocensis]